MKNNKEINQRITDSIIEQLEDAIKNGGVAPWQKPWKSSYNYVSERPYRGINILMLSRRQDIEFLTFLQIQELAKKDPTIKLKKGSKGETVIFWNFRKVKSKDEDDKEVEISLPFMKTYTVFRRQDVENLPSKLVEKSECIEEADLFIDKMKEVCDLNITFSDSAYFAPGLDKVVSPLKEQYNNISEYYATIFHELTHWTGGAKRLNRITTTSCFSPEYAEEELVAEIGASMLLGQFGITQERVADNQIAYLKGWIKRCKDDPNLIVKAAQKAQAALDLMFALVNKTSYDELEDILVA